MHSQFLLVCLNAYKWKHLSPSNQYTSYKTHQYFQVALTDSSLLSLVWTHLYSEYGNWNHLSHLHAWELKGGCAYEIDNQALLLWNLELKRLTLLTSQIRCRCMQKVTHRSPRQYRWLPKSPNLAHSSTSLAFQPPSTLTIISQAQKLNCQYRSSCTHSFHRYFSRLTNEKFSLSILYTWQSTDQYFKFLRPILP